MLESVLGSLTQEYEKRLFSKDHEVKGAQVWPLLHVGLPCMLWCRHVDVLSSCSTPMHIYAACAWRKPAAHS